MSLSVKSTVAPARVVRQRSRRVTPKRFGTRLLWHVIMIIVAIVAVGPLLWMVATSLRDQSTVFGGPLIPTNIVFDAYVHAWNDLMIWRNFINSLIITISSVALIVIASVLAGYAFARLRFVGRNLLFAVVVSALFLPAVATLIPVYLELKSFHLLGGQLGLILVYVAGGIPFSVFLMRTFFEALPKELSEAARIDGANEWQIFRRVMLPLAAPGVATIAIFQMLSVWNELLFASALISDPSQLPLQPAANALIGQYGTDYPGLAAVMTLSALPMVLAYLIFQRWFVAGLTAGAVKA